MTADRKALAVTDPIPSVARSSEPPAALVASVNASRTPSVASVGSLCSGHGGLDLGAALALGPLRHAWHVEVDDAPSKILAARFPGVPNYGDLKALDYALMEPVDLMTAGYPCQPFSDAGLRKGADDPRHLWPYVADAIGHLRPRLVLLENVRGHVRRGLDCVIADLAALGYDASWGVVRASDAGAPHLRERVFVLAADTSDERHERSGQARDWWTGLADQRDAASDAGGARFGQQPTGTPPQEAGPHAGDELADHRGPRPDRNWGPYRPAVRRWEAILGRAAPWATEPRGRGGAHRLSPRFVEWMMGLPEGWVTDVPGLTPNEQLKALGNGVVPQAAALAVTVLLHNLAAPMAEELAA